jgi:hypothetical protein
MVVGCLLPWCGCGGPRRGNADLLTRQYVVIDTIWCEETSLLLGRMKAELLFHQRIDYDDGAIVEMVIWRVPSSVPPSPHGLKYSLFYGRPGVREVGYDNERGKGDHRHFGGDETSYTFTSVEQLMADFWSDVRGLRGGT